MGNFLVIVYYKNGCKDYQMVTQAVILPIMHNFIHRPSADVERVEIYRITKTLVIHGEK